jgi:2Fe-2S ferredoxin
MPSLYVIHRDGSETRIEARIGASVMENIRDSGIDELHAICGGNCSCTTCHVYISEALNLQTMESDEHELLDASTHRKPSSRLSCQIKFASEYDGMKVQIAPED